MRVGLQVQQDILTHERRDIDVLRSRQFGVERKRRNFDFMLGNFSRQATQLTQQFTRSLPVGPERAVQNPEVRGCQHIGPTVPESISGVAMSPSGAIFFAMLRCGIPSGGIWFKWTFTCETFRSSCHWRNASYWRFELFREGSRRPVVAQNAETSPPSLAISFTMRRLR